MTITYTLPGFPDLNQLHEALGDGDAIDPNADWECVPTSIADGLRYLTGRTVGVSGVPFDGDALRDHVYGPGYRGGQAASAYVAFCAAEGVHLEAVNGAPADLVGRIHTELQADRPVVATIPSMWGLGRDGARAYAAAHGIAYTTHVVTFCGYGPGALRAANPWIAPTWHDGDDTYWANDLEANQIWVMSGNGEVLTVGVPAGWHDDGANLVAPNGVAVVLGKRNYVLTHPWSADNWPLGPAQYVPHPDPLKPAGPAGSYQAFNTLWLIGEAASGIFYTVWAGPVALLFGQAAHAAVTAAPTLSPAQVSALAALGSADQVVASAVDAVLAEFPTK